MIQNIDSEIKYIQNKYYLELIDSIHYARTFSTYLSF